jgi:mannitol-1-/sugar-/sorbitol-6-phosphatase
VRPLISALLFDNDGTLVDSHEAVEQSWGQWAREFAPTFRFSEEWFGNRAEDVVRRVLGPELFEVANDRINELEQLTAELTVPLPGTLELIASLAPSQWTIVTSANPRLAAARITAAGLPVPKALVTAADVQRGKPAPDPYLLGATKLGVPIERCAVFEDAVSGINSGLAAGAPLVVGIGERTLDTDAHIVVSSLQGIRLTDSDLLIPDEIRMR